MSATRFNLDVIQVATPCEASWEQMNGDERMRFCEHCQRHVHDLTKMTRADAVDLICRNAGNLCVRYARDEAGAIKTLDYAPAAGRWGLRRWLCLSAVLALAAGAGSFFWTRPKTQPPMPRFIVGDIATLSTPAPPSCL